MRAVRIQTRVRHARLLLLLSILVTGILFVGLYLNVDDPLSLPDIPVEPTHTLNGVDFPSKLWVHRVNTIERAQILLDRFAGIEIDVIYDSSSNVFDVRHRDIPSIGLPLERYFEVLERSHQPLYWIDIKNLNSDNELRQFQKLEWLAAKYDLKKRVIVESPNTISLRRFTDAGFNTSYYLPHFDIESASSEEIEDWVKTVKQSISQSRIRTISADYVMYPLIEKYFSDADTLLWASYRNDRKSDREKIEEIVNIERVKILLVRQPTDHYR